MTESHERRARNRGFTLLEVLIAMSILAVGATSVLAIYVKAVQYAHERKEENRLTEIYNFARTHAQSLFDSWDPTRVQAGQTAVPAPVTVDLTDADAARAHPDPMVREAARKFDGFRYVLTFEDHDLAVRGSSILAHIEIFGLSGRKNETFSHKEFLTRNGSAVDELYKSPSVEERKRSREKEKRGR